MIPFGGSYTRRQWTRGIRLAMHPTGRPLISRLVGLVFVLGAIGLIVVSHFRGDTLSSARLLRISISLSILTYWIVAPYLRAGRAASLPFRRGGKGARLAGVVDEVGIISNGNASGTMEKWDSFVGARLREDLVVLIGIDGLATILPREFFSTEDGWLALRQFVEFNIVAPV